MEFPTESPQRDGFRLDIQALRGWAVLVVVLDHMGLGILPAGFLGVDIFFVISGFLITGIIVQSLSKNDFSFTSFYMRRAKRLLPAAFVVIASTAVASAWFLTSSEMLSLNDQVAGALTYTINFVLMGQVDYFATEAETKPLLHMWSLAVEEQFYLILPLLLVLTPRSYTLRLVVIGAILSFVGCSLLRSSYPNATFYMLPFRAWEFLLGSAAILLIRTSLINVTRYRVYVVWPALIIVASLPFIGDSFPHPGGVALALCAAVAALLLFNHDHPSTPRVVTLTLGRVGDISYSLYLVHWPIFVFSGAAFLGEPPALVSWVGFATAFALAVVLYSFVEVPMRRGLALSARSLVLSVAALSIIIFGVQFGATKLSAPPDGLASFRSPNYGLSKECSYSGKVYEPSPSCVTSPSPKVLVWGDSHAMHLVPGLTDKFEVMQATFSGCAPLLSYARAPSRTISESWSRECFEFNQKVYDNLKSFKSVETVVLAARWAPWVKGRDELVHFGSANKNATFVPSIETAVEAARTTIEAIRSQGKNVIVLGSPPPASFDVGACLERVLTHKVSSRPDCSLNADEARRAYGSETSFLTAVKEATGVKVIMLSKYLCDEFACVTQMEGLPIYRDAGHLSVAGSHFVMNAIGQAGDLDDF